LGEQYRSLNSCGFPTPLLPLPSWPKHITTNILPNFVPLTDVSEF
jgi:hypothetical protein